MSNAYFALHKLFDLCMNALAHVITRTEIQCVFTLATSSQG